MIFPLPLAQAKTKPSYKPSLKVKITAGSFFRRRRSESDTLWESYFKPEGTYLRALIPMPFGYPFGVCT